MSAVASGEIWSWRLHDGRPGLRDADYLVAPDPAIGPVITAQTNCTYRGGCVFEGTARRNMYARSACTLVLLVLAAAVRLRVRPIAEHLPIDVEMATLLCVVSLVLLAGELGAWLFRPRRSSYVGTLGLQSYLRRPGLSARRCVVRFADCARLRVERTRHHINGSYVNTAYRYTWVDARNTCLFVIEGHYDDRRPPAPTEPVLFAHAAELAWRARRGRQ